MREYLQIEYLPEEDRAILETGDLSEESSKSDSFIFYQKLGLEINIPFVRIGTLVTLNLQRRLYGITLSARLDI